MAPNARLYLAFTSEYYPQGETWLSPTIVEFTVALMSNLEAGILDFNESQAVSEVLTFFHCLLAELQEMFWSNVNQFWMNGASIKNVFTNGSKRFLQT